MKSSKNSNSPALPCQGKLSSWVTDSAGNFGLTVHNSWMKPTLLMTWETDSMSALGVPLLSHHKHSGVWEENQGTTKAGLIVLFRDAGKSWGLFVSLQALSSLSEAAVEQCPPGNTPEASNKECLQGHSTGREDGEEEKEMENKAKDGREEGQKVVYELTESLK